MAPDKVWITGAGGLIGSHLVRYAPNTQSPRYDIRGLTRHDFDLTDPGAVRGAFAEQKPRLIIHCAALSKPPDCQVNPSLARKLNVEATALLAGLAAAIPFVFFSSDLVFDGREGNYDESAAPNPLSVYAESGCAKTD